MGVSQYVKILVGKALFMTVLIFVFTSFHNLITVAQLCLIHNSFMFNMFYIRPGDKVINIMSGYWGLRILSQNVHFSPFLQATSQPYQLHVQVSHHQIELLFYPVLKNSHLMTKLVSSSIIFQSLCSQVPGKRHLMGVDQLDFPLVQPEQSSATSGRILQ